MAMIGFHSAKRLLINQFQIGTQTSVSLQKVPPPNLCECLKVKMKSKNELQKVQGDQAFK